MAKKIGLLIVHGIGTQKPGYSASFVGSLKSVLGRISDAPDVVVQEVCWQGLLQPAEDGFIRRSPKLGWMAVRRLFVSYAADALAYQPAETGCNTYATIHREIDKAFRTLLSKIPEDAPIAIVCHSLGTVMVTNFLWDMLEEQSGGRVAFGPCRRTVRSLPRVKLLVTAGSPIAVWSLRYLHGGTPIWLSDGSKWINVYSPNDVIGYPLKGINSLYFRHPQIEDVEMYVGSFLSRLTPLAHTAYFEDRGFIARVAKELSGL